ncbi:unnamed protein product, partial [Ixodes hexagonus]
ESAQAKRRSRDESVSSRATNRDAGSEAEPEPEPDVTEPEVEPLVEPEVDREPQEAADQDERLEEPTEVEAENRESALLSGAQEGEKTEVEPGLETGDQLAGSEPENKVADESGVASVGNEVANGAAGYDRKSKKKGDKGARRSKYQSGTRGDGEEDGKEVDANGGPRSEESSTETSAGDDSVPGNFEADDTRTENEVVTLISASEALDHSAETVSDSENKLEEDNSSRENVAGTLQTGEKKSEGDELQNVTEPAVGNLLQTPPDSEEDGAPGYVSSDLVEEGESTTLDAKNRPAERHSTNENISSTVTDINGEQGENTNNVSHLHEDESGDAVVEHAEENGQLEDAVQHPQDDLASTNLEHPDDQEQNSDEYHANESITSERAQETASVIPKENAEADTNSKDDEEECKKEISGHNPSDNAPSSQDTESSLKDRSSLETSVNEEQPEGANNEAEEMPAPDDSVTPAKTLTEKLDSTIASSMVDETEQISRAKDVISESSFPETFPEGAVDTGLSPDEISKKDETVPENVSNDRTEHIFGERGQEIENPRAVDLRDEDEQPEPSEGRLDQSAESEELPGTNVNLEGAPVKTNMDVIGDEVLSLTEEHDELAKSPSQDQEPSYLANMIASREQSTDKDVDEMSETGDTTNKETSQLIADGGNISTLGESQVAIDDTSGGEVKEGVAEDSVTSKDSNSIYQVNENTSDKPDLEDGENSVPSDNVSNVIENAVITDRVQVKTDDESAMNLPDNEPSDDLKVSSPLFQELDMKLVPGGSEEGVVPQSEDTGGNIQLKDGDNTNTSPISEPANIIDNAKVQPKGAESSPAVGEG